MNQKDKIEPSLAAVEKALLNKPDRSYAQPEHRGIHELIGEVRATLELTLATLSVIERRLAEFDRLQADFYTGKK